MATLTTLRAYAGAAGIVILLLCGCGAPPPRVPPGAGEAGMKPAVATMIEAVIVDVRPDARTLTVKESREHATWMVSLAEQSRIFGAGQPDMRLEDLGVGDHVRISGTSRIDLILKADAIELLDRSPN